MASAADCTCPVCMELLDEPVVMPCKHELCHACFKQHVTITSLHCPICRKRLASWMRRAMSAGTLIDKKRSEEIKKFRAQLVERENAASSSSSSPSTSSASSAERLMTIAMPGEVHAEYVAEKLKLQAELEEQRRQEEAASEALIKQLMDEEEKAAEQRRLMEDAATDAYIKRFLRSERPTFPESSHSVSNTFRPVCDSTLAVSNLISRHASTASWCSSRDLKGSASSGCATMTGQEKQTPASAARNCSESSSSACSSAAASSETVFEQNLSVHNESTPMMAYDEAEVMTDPLAIVSNSGSASNPAVPQHLDCYAEQGVDAPSSHMEATSARSSLPARLKSATRGRGRWSRRSIEACTSARVSRPIGHGDNGSPSRRSRSRSPVVGRQLEAALRTGCRGRKVCRDLLFGSQQSSVTTILNAPAFQARRPRGSRGTRGRPSRSPSHVSEIPSTSASRVLSDYRGASRRWYGSRTRGGLPGRRGRGGSPRRVGSQTRGGCRFGGAHSPDARASCEPSSRASRPRGREASRIYSSSSQSPDAVMPSTSASLRCLGSKKVRRGYSRDKRGSARVPPSPSADARTSSVSRGRIGRRYGNTNSSNVRRGWNRSKPGFFDRSSTHARGHGYSGRQRGAFSSSLQSSASATFSSGAVEGRPDVRLTASAELAVPDVHNDVAPQGEAAAEAVRPAAVAHPVSLGRSQLPQSDAEIARRLQILFNREHKYKLNGIRVPESEGEYGLRSRSGRRDCQTGFSEVAAGALSASSFGSSSQSGNRQLLAPSSLQPPANADGQTSGQASMS